MKNNLLISPETAHAFDHSVALLDKLAGSLRSIAHSMLPEALINPGLGSAVNNYCSSVSQGALVQVIYLPLNVNDANIPQHTAAMVYRTIQQLVDNAIQHAGAGEIQVRLEGAGNTLAITVEDDGHGFDVSSLATGEGMGYVNLQSRVAHMGGMYYVQSLPGKGTIVYVQVPVG